MQLCNCVQSQRGHTESNLRASEEVVSFYLVLGQLLYCPTMWAMQLRGLFASAHRWSRQLRQGNGQDTHLSAETKRLRMHAQRVDRPRMYTYN